MAEGTIIYVVDDDAAVRESIEALLMTAELAAEIRCYESGASFLEAVDESANGCVLLDLRMPDVGGLAVQRELQLRESNLAVIIVTGHGDVPLAVEAMRLGAFHFVEKPFADDLLIANITEAIEHSRATQREQLSRKDAESRLVRLTARERDVLRLLVVGRLNKVIAYELEISARTVEVHRARIMEKLQVRSLSEAVRLVLAAKQEDLIPDTN